MKNSENIHPKEPIMHNRFIIPASIFGLAIVLSITIFFAHLERGKV